MEFFFSLFLLCVIAYYASKKELVAPSVLFALSFCISGVIFSLNSIIWDYELSGKTKQVILSGISLFIIGSCFCNFNKKKNSHIKNIAFRISDGSIAILIVISFFYLLLRLLDIITVTGSLNIIGGLGAYRGHEGTTIFETLMKIIGPFCNALNIAMIIVIVTNRFSGRKVKYSYYIPIFNYFVSCALSSSRIDVIYTFVYFIIIYLFVYKIKFGLSIGIKQLKTVVLGALLLGITFFGLGFLTGKSQNQESAFDNISMYAASSFAAFDYYLDGFKYNSDNFGKETFYGVSNMLSWFGVENNIVEERNKEFLNLGSMKHSTNVYTCFQPLLHDFNYLGMYLILFLEGLLFQLFYKKTKRDFETGGMSWLVFYAYLCGYLMLSSVAERIFTCLLTLTTLMFLFSIVLLKKYIVVVNLESNNLVQK